MTSCYSVYSTWWSSLKANWQLIIIIIIKTILVAIIKNQTSSMPIVLWLYSLIWKKVTKMVGCDIVFKLTTKPMLFFWVGKAKLIELRFRRHIPATRL